ncbi:hypothetical protein Dimus_014751 [Dionaea muscipula]
MAEHRCASMEAELEDGYELIELAELRFSWVHHRAPHLFRRAHELPTLPSSGRRTSIHLHAGPSIGSTMLNLPASQREVELKLKKLSSLST